MIVKIKCKIGFYPTTLVLDASIPDQIEIMLPGTTRCTVEKDDLLQAFRTLFPDGK